jgi:hypothetical protein
MDPIVPLTISDTISLSWCHVAPGFKGKPEYVSYVRQTRLKVA